ncbi:hypothetical protein KODAMA_00320 [Serratia phage vB_SmaM-Kodama]|nr:hypothetical protein KODAMA_00320 [Serratia phage vB_SmaM-Kodama]
MSSAYRALDSKRPRLSGQTLVDLSDLVKRRQHTAVGEGDSFGNNVGSVLTSLTYIVDGLMIFRKVAPVLSKQRVLLSELTELLQFVRTTRRLTGIESNPELRSLIDSLNVHRTYFFEGICDNSATVKPYLDAVLSMTRLIPVLSDCNNSLSAALIYPFIDDSDEVLGNALETLKNVSENAYNVNYESSGPNLFKLGKTLPELWEEELVNTPSIEISWANEKPNLGIVDQLFNQIGSAPLESAIRSLSQVRSLYTVRPVNEEIKNVLSKEYGKLALSWEAIADRVQILLYVVLGMSNILEKSVEVSGVYLFHQFEEDEPMLNLVTARCEHLLGNKNG